MQLVIFIVNNRYDVRSVDSWLVELSNQWI